MKRDNGNYWYCPEHLAKDIASGEKVSLILLIFREFRIARPGSSALVVLLRRAL